MKKLFKLNDLTVKSFVTSMKREGAGALQGGRLQPLDQEGGATITIAGMNCMTACGNACPHTENPYACSTEPRSICPIY